MSGGKGTRTRVKMRERAINVKSRLVLQDTPDLGADEDDDQTQDDGNPVGAAMAVDNPAEVFETGEHDLIYVTESPRLTT